MSDVVIRAVGLGKRYLIGHQVQAERYKALRDVLARTAKGMARSARDMLHGRQLIAGDEVEEFWALKDVNFEIKRGDIVGVIGRNGAGKSTLLKILSRITEPSIGRVEINGRVASLLEVGTGFHAELSGRENIFLNGAILGMSRAEIKQKFDEIVAFSEVEKFLDTPVKYYSSGMYVRLAFAVAAHLEPEILVVDEVLAVGDAEFQKKCLGKMGEVAGHGRTILFVSHNIGAIKHLCAKGLLLESGRVAADGAIVQTIENYSRSIVRSSSSVAERKDRSGSGAAKIRNVQSVWSEQPKVHQSFKCELITIRDIYRLRIIIAVYNSDINCVLRLDSCDVLKRPVAGSASTYQVAMPHHFGLAAGSYYLNVAIFDGEECCDHIEHALELEILHDHVSHLTKSHRSDEMVCVKSQWREVTNNTNGHDA